MKLRLRTEFERARSEQKGGEAGRERLEAALSELETARISTVHAFAGDLLKERPIVARIDPDFEVTDDIGAEQLARLAFDEWFEHGLESPPEGVRRALRRVTRGGEGARGRLFQAAVTLIDHRDFDGAYRRPELAREQAIDEALDAVRELGQLAPLGESGNYLTGYLNQILTWSVRIWFQNPTDPGARSRRRRSPSRCRTRLAPSSPG